MCTACITAALIVAGATTTGGLTAVVVKKLRAKTEVKNIDPQTLKENKMDRPRVMPRVERLAARKELLAKEKEPREEDNIWDPRDES